MTALASRIIWLDVDGTSETGAPASWDECIANQAQPPVGRSYNYNFPLFDALEMASDTDISSVMLFTAYDVAGACHDQGVLRCELLDWIAAAHPCLRVSGVATVIDPAFGHAPGSYYRSVIEPCERMLLSKAAGEGPEGLTKLSAEDIVHTRSPEDWTNTTPRRFDEILRHQQELVDSHLAALPAGSPGDCRMDKERLARYCLQHMADSTEAAMLPRILFLDDSRSYIEQVERACSDLAVVCQSVHVTSAMQEVGDFLQILKPSLPRSRQAGEAGPSQCTLS